VEEIENAMQAIGAGLQATQLPVVRSFGVILDVAGTYIAGNALAIAESALNPNRWDHLCRIT
jgi:hypothetical protein